ncbi:hypothetical protein BD408DRAFT_377738 [Parasitella parasitica]|nr:hypothetical protein BD408DRAFT_377738 [Parasitella parasitica]
MSFRAPSPPSTGYNIIDIRDPIPCGRKTAQDVSVIARPPSPQTSDSSEDAFNGSDLVNTILESLDKPADHKSIPTYILYDKKGLQLFDQITQLDDEYYLTGAELDILVRRSEEMVDRLQDGSAIFELGAGALRKTQVVLRAIEKKRVHVTYYALDLDQHELDKSLASLGEFQFVQLYGLLGTYDQGIPWISKNFTNRSVQKNFLWMGSSIGNQNRLESAMFLRKLQRMCMEPGDLFVIGFDRRNDPAKVELAYDDSHGVTREFIMNGLDHVNRIMGQDNFIRRGDFDYHSIYQEKQGRHLSHYRALRDVVIRYKTSQKDYAIAIQKDELIHVEHSYKYSLDEVESILTAADLNVVEYWSDSKHQYRLVVAENRPFMFERNLKQIHQLLFPSKDVFDQEPIRCYHCNEGQFDLIRATESDESKTFDYAMNRTWPIDVLPSLHEWQELWKSWDVVTLHMLNHRTMLYESPISLRHPFIFYLGHTPAFVDIQLSRHQVDKALGPTDLTEPVSYAEIFERGIDPDIDDPTQCNPHSTVPTSESDWPSVNAILAYQKKVRQRVQRLLVFWESEAFKTQSSTWINTKQREARVVWMCFEHEAMHLETLLYMLIQSPNTLPPVGVALPSWKLRMRSNVPPTLKPLAESPYLKLPGGIVSLGHDDYESKDNDSKAHEFGWDNENPERQVSIPSFEIQARPVTNGEYFQFLQKTHSDSIPASWLKQDGQLFVKTVFGPCPLVYAQNWPVQTSFNQANAYAQHKGSRLPSEAEVLHFRDSVTTEKWANIGFENWSPTDVSNEKVHALGDVWEWTSTVWDTHQGFESSQIYPGYSADFFDGKHCVVLGGSWATHPRIAERRSFRNWYQAGYAYIFGGFRLCH